MALERAWIFNLSVNPSPEPGDPAGIRVQFNPTDLNVDRSVHWADVNVPGLRRPLLQFVRGEAEKVTLNLFLDATDVRGLAGEREGVERRLTQLRQFVRIQPDLHTPPVCRFQWRNFVFDGVATALKEQLMLFADDGTILRAKVALDLKAYESAASQLNNPPRFSPDRTRVRVLKEGESLDRIAAEVYGDPRLWRAIAEANGIDRPRFVAPGTTLRIPAL